MQIARATFVNNEVEPGWQILKESVPIGKVYKVDLSRVEFMTMLNTETGKMKRLSMVWVVEPGPAGWLPMMAFKVES